jgi:hypothetical protein
MKAMWLIMPFSCPVLSQEAAIPSQHAAWLSEPRSLILQAPFLSNHDRDIQKQPLPKKVYKWLHKNANESF